MRNQMNLFCKGAGTRKNVSDRLSVEQTELGANCVPEVGRWDPRLAGPEGWGRPPMPGAAGSAGVQGPRGLFLAECWELSGRGAPAAFPWSGLALPPRGSCFGASTASFQDAAASPPSRSRPPPVLGTDGSLSLTDGEPQSAVGVTCVPRDGTDTAMGPPPLSSPGSSRTPRTRPSETRFASLGFGQQGGQVRPAPVKARLLFA